MPASVRTTGCLVVTLVLALLASVLGTPPARASAPGPAPGVSFATAPDPLARYVGQVSCDPVAKPGTSALAATVLAAYRTGRSGGITRSCSTGGTSEHKEGRAWDWMLDASDPAHRATADAFLAWLTGPDAQGVAAGNARRLGVMYVIWDRRTWQSHRATSTPGSGWKAYTGASPHTDHIHISLSWDGAWQRTSWWTGSAIKRQDLGPCQVFVGQPAPKYTAPNYTACPPPVRPEVDWWIRSASAGPGAATARFGYGSRGDAVLACDIDGDGLDSVVVYRDGLWAMRKSATPGPADLFVRYGDRGMRPVCGDWNGDGKDTIGVFDGHRWWLRNSNTPGAPDLLFAYGWPGADHVVGDWDGDGKDSIGVYDGHRWWLRNSNTPGAPDLLFAYGWPGAELVVGDWDGDGRDTIGVYDGRWWLRNSNTPGAPDLLFGYGWRGAEPVAGKWARGGRDGVAIADGGV